MITNGTAPDQNYYSVKFASMPYSIYAYGDSPLSAIREAQAELMSEAMDTTPLGGALVRRAVYGEWDCGTECYRNDGTHSHAFGLHRQGEVSTWIL